MALVPMLFRDYLDDFLEESLRPTRQRGRRSALDDLLPEDIVFALDPYPRRNRRKRSWRRLESENDAELDGVVAKKPTGDLEINVNVKQFKPEEITVKATDKFVTVEGKHEQKDDENGYVLRHFVRRYQLPEGHDNEKIVSTLSSDGVLTISAPKLALPEPEKERMIPVEKVGKQKELTDKQQSKTEKAVTLENVEE